MCEDVCALMRERKLCVSLFVGFSSLWSVSFVFLFALTSGYMDKHGKEERGDLNTSNCSKWINVAGQVRKLHLFPTIDFDIFHFRRGQWRKSQRCGWMSPTIPGTNPDKWGDEAYLGRFTVLKPNVG